MKGEKLTNFLGTFGMVVGIITSLASIYTGDIVISAIVGLLVLFLGVTMGVHYFKEKKSFSEEDLAILIEEGPEVRPLKDYAELQEVARLDEETYGKHSVDANGLLDWWEHYRNGIYVLTYNRSIIGALGIWPLTENAFNALIKGRLRESDLRGDDICKGISKHSYWYCADIILKKDYREKHLSSLLLEKAVNAWLQQELLADEVSLCAIAATNNGRHLLEKIGFHKIAVSPDKLPVYVLTESFVKLQQYFEGLREFWNSKVAVKEF